MSDNTQQSKGSLPKVFLKRFMPSIIFLPFAARHGNLILLCKEPL
jgi:hypothetical protein